MPVRFSIAVAAAALLLPIASITAFAAAPAYRSVFDGYRAFSEQAVVSWPEANGLVGRIGGWQAYAREAQGGAVDAAGEKPAQATPAPSPAASTASGAHTGHRRP